MALALACAVSPRLYAAEAPKPPEPKHAAVDFQWHVGIPMKDGVRLHATVYRPKGQSRPLPCIFTLTPYVADSYHDRGVYFASNGYVFLTIDVRGRGASEGEFRAFHDDPGDGPQIIEWLAKQTYCNGKVAMWGGSYAGKNQWTIAKEGPKHLATIVPAAAARASVDFPMSNNISGAYLVQWLTLTGGKAAQYKIFGDREFWTEKFREHYLAHRPFAELDRSVGNPLTLFQEWLAHPVVDAYWDAQAGATEDIARIDIPVLTITGAYDGDQPGALSWYRTHVNHAPRRARNKHFLIIGPWDHAGTRTPKADVGGLTFGEASLLDLNDLHRQWYDWTLKSGDKPEFLKDRVAYYVIGAERWRYAKSLDAVTDRLQPVYLYSNGSGSNDVVASGRLSSEPPGAVATDGYKYDPLDTAPGREESIDPNRYLVDQEPVIRNLSRSLIYHTAPFEADTEISGFFRLSVWISMDQPDTDFRADVYEILADGSSVRLTSDRLRARYRESLRAEKPVPAGDVLRYELDDFDFISRVVKKGSRLRLVFGPINSIYTQKNYNSGGAVAMEGAKDARTVNVTLHQGPGHPSALYIPIAAR